MSVSGNDDFEVNLDEFENFSDSDDNECFENDSDFEASYEDLENDFVSRPFSSDDLRIDYEASTLASDRASSTVDYSGYFENITVLLIFILVSIIGFGLSVSFILGVKK